MFVNVFWELEGNMRLTTIIIFMRNKNGIGDYEGFLNGKS